MQSPAEDAEEDLKTMRNEVEYPVLMDINDDRTRQGLSPVVKLTVPVLKKHLKGKTIGGAEWRMGNKKREDLIEDYRPVPWYAPLEKKGEGGGVVRKSVGSTDRRKIRQTNLMK